MRSLFLLLSIVSAAFAQTKMPLQTTPDDPKLFRYFFESPAPAAIAISALDSPKFALVFQSANQNLGAVEQYRQKYLLLMLKQHKRPDPKALQGFEAAKNVESAAGIYRLRRTLSPQGWQQVRAHVNGVFLNSLTGLH